MKNHSYNNYNIAYSIIKALDYLRYKNGDSEFFSLVDISKCCGYSISYMEANMKILREEGIVASKKGSKGGYKLIWELDQVTVGELVECFNMKDDFIGKLLENNYHTRLSDL